MTHNDPRCARILQPLPPAARNDGPARRDRLTRPAHAGQPDAKRILTTVIGQDGVYRQGISATLRASQFKVVQELRPTDPIEFDAHAKSSLFILIESDGHEGELKRITSSIRTRAPGACIAILSLGHKKDSTSHLSIGVLPQSISPASLMLALKLLMRKEVYIDNIGFENISVSTANIDVVSGNLSSRELEILELLRQGQSNKHIAGLLKIEEATVKAHVRSVLRKTGASNRTQAAMKAYTIFANAGVKELVSAAGAFN